MDHRGPLVISPLMVPELDYMVGRDYGEEARLAFLDEVDRGAYRLELFGVEDFSRARELMDAHPHLPGFGIADASNVVLAERHGTTDNPHHRPEGLPPDRAPRRLVLPHPPYDS